MKTKMRIMTITNDQSFNAGPKAPRDIISILKKEYDVKEVYLVQTNSFIKKIIYRIKMFNNMVKSKKNDEVLVLQFPMYENSKILNKFFMFSLKRVNRDKTVILIHDLEGLRNKNENLNKQDIERLNMAKYVIAHNEKMKKYLIDEGVESKIYTLKLFDYLCKDEEKENAENSEAIIYAGNLVQAKSPFIYQLNEKKMNFKMNLYGIGLDKGVVNNQISYKGKFQPDELPNKLVGKLGLIWDGNYDESDQNEGMKRYTKYNNPHKLSCYLASGVPVIAWEKAAIADFINENNIGYTINSIYDINNISILDWNKKLENVKVISKNVRSGYYTKKIFEDIVKDMKGE